MANEVSVIGLMIMQSTSEEKEEQFSHVDKGLEAGWLRPVMWKSMELEFAKDAHKDIMENSGAKGQIALTVNSSV